MARILALALTLLFLGMAGCATPVTDSNASEAAASPQDAAKAPPALQTTVTRDTFDWLAGVGVPTTGQDVQVMAKNAAVAPVPDGATLLVVYTNWTCAMPACTMHVSLFDSKTSNGAPVVTSEGVGSVRIEVQNPKESDWLVAVHSDGPVAQVKGSFVFQVTAPEGAE